MIQNTLVKIGLLLLIVITTFNACKDDDVSVDSPIDNIAQDITITHTPDLFTGSLSGIIVDENLEPLSEVLVKIETTEIITDENGFFNFQNIELDALGTVLKASKSNYWTMTKMVIPSKIQQNQTRVMLQPKIAVRNIESTAGGTVNFDEIIKIDFPTDAFVTADGAPYDGTVVVSTIHLDPTDDNFALMSPGDFRAFDSESELVTLVSLGMAGVELTGSNNEILELKTDKTATLSIAAPDGVDTPEVPLWHFDEESGYWLENGLSRREGDFYVGTVSHFSWWNVDVPFPPVKLSVTIINEDGVGIPGIGVFIKMADESSIIGLAYTGNRGLFCNYVPKDVNLIMQLRNECGNIFYEEEIGPFEDDTLLDPIVFDSNSGGENIIEVCGNLVDCNGGPVTNGYLIVKYDDNQSFIPVDENGDFCSAVNICTSTSFEIYGIDLNSNLQGTSQIFEISDSPVNDIALTICDQLTNFFSYQIGQEQEIIITDFTIALSLDFLIWGASLEFNGISPGGIIDGENYGEESFTFGYYNIALATPMNSIECEAFICNSLDVEIIEFNGVGNPIILNVDGVSDDGLNFSISINGILEEG